MIVIQSLCTNTWRIIRNDSNGRHSLFRDISTKRKIHGHPAVDDAAGFDRKNAGGRSYYSGFRVVRRRYGELCMVSPAASPRAGSFPCMPCICRVIDGCVNFIGDQYRYESQGYLHRLEDYDTLARSFASGCERVIFLGAINLCRHVADAESATMNGPTIEHRYPARTFLAEHVTHHRIRERVLLPLQDLCCCERKIAGFSMIVIFY